MLQQTVFHDTMKLAASTAGEQGRPAILLLHGWPQSRSLYDRVIDRLGEQFHVLAFDLPTVGDSVGAPPSADKSQLAGILLSASEGLGGVSPVVLGIDVGGMIAFAAARDHPSRVRGAAIGNTVIPGLDPWDDVIRDPRIWHFAFHQVPNLPELLVAGHERAYFDFFFDILGNKDCPLPDEMRGTFADAYSDLEALKAGFDWYRAFESDAKHNSHRCDIDVPILYFRGDSDGRTIEPYVKGLRAAGALHVQPCTLRGTAEFSPFEAPGLFCDMVTHFASQCFRIEPAVS
jgi:pimeloyl-ACP methyl ester carboxylesterase